MPFTSAPARAIAQDPRAFAMRVLKAFKRNQGLLLAGAVAYYALLSIVPLLILIVIVLSHWIDPGELLDALRRYLEWVVPGQSKPLLEELSGFLAHQQVTGWLLAGTMIFFSSLAFTVLEKSMSVIFMHRIVERRRRTIVSVLLPYCFVLLLGAGTLIVTLVSAGLEGFGQREIRLLGHAWSLGGVSTVLLYLLGFLGEVFVLTSIYLVMPVGRLRFSHALIGGVTAAALWEITRHVLAWYFATLSQVQVVYGSLTTAIVVLLSLELIATLLLLGAQVIAEYEQVAREVAAAG